MNVEFEIRKHKENGNGYLGVPLTRSVPRPGQPDSFFMSYSALMNESTGKQVVAALKSDSRVRNFEGVTISTGSGGDSFSVESLAIWYMWLVNQDGKVAADAALEKFLAERIRTVIPIVAIHGLRLKFNVELLPNYKLISVESLPEGRMKDALLHEQWNNKGIKQRTYMCALTGKCEIPTLMDMEDPASNDMTPVREWQAHALDLAWLLNCMPGTLSVPICQSVLIDSTTPFGPFMGSGRVVGHSWFHLTDFKGSDASNLDVARFVSVFNAFQAKGQKERIAWRLALTRLAAAKSQVGYSSALDLGIASEITLLSNQAPNEQLGLALRLRGAWLLEPTDWRKRKVIHDRLKLLYKCRSAVAHTGHLPPKDQKEFGEHRLEIIEIVERAVQKCLLSEATDWESIMLALN